jgi:predicted neuraminidase
MKEKIFSLVIVCLALVIISKDIKRTFNTGEKVRDEDIINDKAGAEEEGDNSKHEYAFTPQKEGSIRYAWIARGTKLPSEKRTGEADWFGKFQYMHMAMSETLPNGSLAIAFQASPTDYEGSIWQALYWTVSDDDGETFGEPEEIARDDQLPVWTPVLKTSGERVFLMYTVSSRKCRYYDSSRNALRHSPGGDVVYKVSDDNGRTWSSSQVILSYNAEDGMPKVIANTLTELESGSWILPFWREPGKTCPQVKAEVKDEKMLRKGSAGIIRSDDQGLTWQVYGNLTKPGTWLIENTIVERKEKKDLVQHFRTKTGYAYVSTSSDGGKTWSEAMETSLPNPNSKMHTLRIDDKNDDDTGEDLLGEKSVKNETAADLALKKKKTKTKSFFVAAYNHHPRTRDPLVLAISPSHDGIESWRPFAKLEPGGMGEVIKPELDPALAPGAIQYAYPIIHASKDNKYLYVAYSVMHGAKGKLTCFGIRMARMLLENVPRDRQ